MAMQGDSEARLPPPPPLSSWTLPAIIWLEILRVRYRPPRKQILAGKIIEIEEGIEIRLRTDGDMPIRALPAALYVGSAEILNSQHVGPRQYRFFVLDEEVLRPGAAIRLGWMGTPPKREKKSRFRYETPGDKVVTLERPVRNGPGTHGLWALLLALIRWIWRRLFSRSLPS